MEVRGWVRSSGESVGKVGPAFRAQSEQQEPTEERGCGMGPARLSSASEDVRGAGTSAGDLKG